MPNDLECDSAAIKEPPPAKYKILRMTHTSADIKRKEVLAFLWYKLCYRDSNESNSALTQNTYNLLLEKTEQREQ